MYEEEDVKKIAKAIEVKPDEIKSCLREFEAAATWYGLDQREPKRLYPSELKRRLRRIVNNADRLLKSLGVDSAEDAADGPAEPAILDAITDDRAGDEGPVLSASERLGRFVTLLEGVAATVEFRDRAKAAATEVVKVKKLITPAGHRGDAAINKWIAAMLGPYREITGKHPGTSVGGFFSADKGKAIGPLIRFLKAAGEPLDIELSSESWRERIRQILDPDSLAD